MWKVQRFFCDQGFFFVLSDPLIARVVATMIFVSRSRRSLELDA